MLRRWPAIELATRRDALDRVPFVIGGSVVGSVARTQLAALQAAGPALRVDGQGVALEVPAWRRDAVLAELHQALRAQGLIRGWRDETFALVDPATLQPLALIERAAARFWGTLTQGAHATGYVVGADGRPDRLWIAQRSLTKATDPGLFDNLVGGGVPAGQTPREALVREGWEEAGLPPAVMARATPGRVLRLERDILEGLQHEWIHAFDLRLRPGETPCNQDGEVAGFRMLPPEQALELAAGDAMTVDAALVTLDFALRHGLLARDAAAALQARSAALWVGVAA